MNTMTAMVSNKMLELAVRAQTLLQSGSGSDGLNGLGSAEVLNRGRGVFGIVQSVFTAVGIIVVIVTFWRVVKQLIVGKFGDAGRAFFGGVLAAIVCFNIYLPVRLVEASGGLFTKAIEALSGIVG